MSAPRRGRGPRRGSSATNDHGTDPQTDRPTDPRRVAVDTLVRIDRDGAYANLVLPKVLARSGLTERDRAFVTQLVYGTTRYRRACDWFVDRFALGELDPPVRAALRMGTYQLRMLGTAPHAAVSATVEAAPRRARGLVNAVLRKVANADDAWPSDAVRLSYPDWIVDVLSTDLGGEVAEAALVAMNGAAPVTERADGYVQDLASQRVAEAVGIRPGERVLDLCAAPGGKATALATALTPDDLLDDLPESVDTPEVIEAPAAVDAPAVATPGTVVVAADSRPKRAGLVAANRDRLGIAPTTLPVVVADGSKPPFPSASFDRVLVDAPCSGLGSLRRRADARWRIDDDAPRRLAEVQGRLLDAAASLLVPGGTLVYSVCTMTSAETSAVAERFTASHPGWSVVPPPDGPWRPWGTGGLLLPQDEGTDGMALFAWQAPS